MRSFMTFTAHVFRSQSMRWGGGDVACVRRSAYGVLVGKADGKRPLVRARGRQEDNMQMDIK
jgi:hypothetical protein